MSVYYKYWGIGRWAVSQGLNRLVLVGSPLRVCTCSECVCASQKVYISATVVGVDWELMVSVSILQFVGAHLWMKRIS